MQEVTFKERQGQRVRISQGMVGMDSLQGLRRQCDGAAGTSSGPWEAGEGSDGGAEAERHIGPRLQGPGPIWELPLCANEEIDPFFGGTCGRNILPSLLDFWSFYNETE